MLLLLFACLALHPIYDLHLHAVDIHNQASAIVANQDQPYLWLSERDIEEVLHEYCLNRGGSIERIVENKTALSEPSTVQDPSTNENAIVKQTDKEGKATKSSTSVKTIYSEDILTQSTYFCTTVKNQKLDHPSKKKMLEKEFVGEQKTIHPQEQQRIQDGNVQADERDYLRIHAVGKNRKRVHLISVENNDVHAYPMSMKTMKDPLLNSMLRKQEQKRIFEYRYTGSPSSLAELSPLPFGYQITEETDTGMTLKKTYVERINDINPKVAVFKRIEIVDIQLQPNIQISQTTTHIFLSDLYGRQVEEVEFQDLRLLQSWLTEIMIQHSSLFSNHTEQDEEDSLDTEEKKEIQEE